MTTLFIKTDLFGHPCPLSVQSPSRLKRTQPRAIRKMQEVSEEQGSDDTLFRERESLYSQP